MTAYRHISFDAIHDKLSVRVMEDSNCMIALDLLSVLTGNDRKKASQTLARIASKPDTASLLTLRHASPSSGKKTPRKLISFSNAIQLLLALPKRTVDLQTRRSVAGILADHFEAPVGCERVEPPKNNETTIEALTLKQTLLQIEQQAMELEQKRKQQPLENLKCYFELMKQCGPLKEEDFEKFKRMIAEQMGTT
jgi:hypothetical protein